MVRRQFSIIVIFLLSGLMDLPGLEAQATERPPNIVFVLADDLGWAELGCYGNTFHETPNLDRMAREGLRFTHAYAAAPVCSPYRAALLTGQHPARLGILDYLRPNSANHLPTGLVTLPERLRQSGYRTGMIGKWHLTGYRHHDAEFESRPPDHGFDWNLGSEVKSVGNGANTWPYVFRRQPIRWLDFAKNRMGPHENLTDRLNLEAVDFIERNGDRPFFLFLAHYAPHSILNGRPDLVDKYRRKRAPGRSGRENCYLCEDAGLGKGDPGNHWAVDHNPHLAAMLEGIDEGIGLIRGALDEQGLLENTVFIFSSDNGGESNVTSNAFLRGGKSELYEGGIRVPLLVQWPAKIRGGGVSRQATMNTDFFPTLLEAAGFPLEGEQAVDGVSLLEHWVEPTRSVERDGLYWHYPIDRPHFLGGFSGGAIQKGDWKMIERFATGEPELYHLGQDPSEQVNLAGENPLKLGELSDQLEAWRVRVGACRPSPPLLSEAGQLEFAEHFSGRTSRRLTVSGGMSVASGVLVSTPSDEETRWVQVNELTLKEAIVRIDFRRRGSGDLRLVAKTDGKARSVISIGANGFSLEVSGEMGKARNECAYAFEPDRWYTLTVEFVGEHLLAHVDHQHVVSVQYPQLKEERTTLTIRSDVEAMALDNIVLLSARKSPKWTERLEQLRSRH